MVTLVESMPVSFRFQGAGGQSSSLRPRFAFLGHLFPSLEGLGFRSVLASYEHLDAWLGASPIDFEHPDQGTIVVTVRTPPPTDVALDGGKSIRIAHSHEYKFQRARTPEASLKLTAYVGFAGG